MKTIKDSTESTHRKPLRLWPGVVIVILLWIVRYLIPAINPDMTAFGILGGLVGGIAIVIWWAFFSRAQRIERWLAIALTIVALSATSHFIDKSISHSLMGMMFAIYSIPVISLAFVVWAVVMRHLSNKVRRVTMIATILIASGFWVLIRTNGMDGEARHDFAWRWAKTHEERLLEKGIVQSTKAPLDSVTVIKEAEWPGFQGPDRNGIIHGVRIGTNWTKLPPVEMWRQSVGPGCSSMAIQGSLLYTQEQRGEFEMVTCYNLNTGQPVWSHRDSTRFWDAHAGAGPRSTPTISKGRIYTLGATGILNVLDEMKGTVIWSRNAAKDTKVKIPIWGYASSPLVTDSVVIIAISGQLLAYDLATGSKRWSGDNGGESYSSPQLFTINGIRQVLFMNKAGATSFDPVSGKELWKLPLLDMQIIQPYQINESDLLLSSGYVKGMRRVTLKNGPNGWSTEERWSSGELIQNFNDYVVHKGHIYGFEGAYLACFDLDKGNRVWKGGRYTGELILLADQDLLLILSEKGDLALVKATPEQFTELARVPGIKGRCWNHPALAGNILVVRNSQEMAAFKLPVGDK
jgi:outer membrane protein assembly factor BamB